MTTGAEAGCAYESVGARSKALSSAPSEHWACKVTSVVSDFATPWTAPRQAPLSMGFSRQEYWSRLPCPPPGDLPHPGTEPASLTSACIGRRFFTTGATCEAAQIKHNHRHANWSSLQVRRRPTPPSPCLGAPTCRDQPAGRPSCSPSNLCQLSLGLTSASPVAV